MCQMQMTGKVLKITSNELFSKEQKVRCTESNMTDTWFKIFRWKLQKCVINVVKMLYIWICSRHGKTKTEYVPLEDVQDVGLGVISEKCSASASLNLKLAVLWKVKLFYVTFLKKIFHVDKLAFIFTILTKLPFHGIQMSKYIIWIYDLASF